MYLYDEALVDKLKSWTKMVNLTVLSPEQSKGLFEISTEENDDKFQLPLITVSRPYGCTLGVPRRQPLSYDAGTIQQTQEKTMQLNAIPIELHYQLDVFARYQKEADELMRNLVFNIINFPTLTILLPYQGVELHHESTLDLQPDITANNSIINDTLLGKNFTRLTANIDVKDAYLFDLRVRDNWQIETKFFIEDKEESLDDEQD